MRLDRLPGLAPAASSLNAPLLITARHPREGGNLSSAQRRKLLGGFLPRASALDLELRSLKTLRSLWEEARARKLLRVCSVHDFDRTPSSHSLTQKFAQARAAGADIFKLVARADSVNDFSRLRDFLVAHPREVAVMATGKYGARSRREFPGLGSRLVYAPITRAFHRGQLTLAQLRRSLARSAYLGSGCERMNCQR